MPFKVEWIFLVKAHMFTRPGSPFRSPFISTNTLLLIVGSSSQSLCKHIKKLVAAETDSIIKRELFRGESSVVGTRGGGRHESTMEEPLDTVINGECSNLHCTFRFKYSGKSLCLLNMSANKRISGQDFIGVALSNGYLCTWRSLRRSKVRRSNSEAQNVAGRGARSAQSDDKCPPLAS